MRGAEAGPRLLGNSGLRPIGASQRGLAAAQGAGRAEAEAGCAPPPEPAPARRQCVGSAGARLGAAGGAGGGGPAAGRSWGPARDTSPALATAPPHPARAPIGLAVRQGRACSAAGEPHAPRAVGKCRRPGRQPIRTDGGGGSPGRPHEWRRMAGRGAGPRGCARARLPGSSCEPVIGVRAPAGPGSRRRRRSPPALRPAAGAARREARSVGRAWAGPAGNGCLGRSSCRWWPAALGAETVRGRQRNDVLGVRGACESFLAPGWNEFPRASHFRGSGPLVFSVNLREG